MKESGKANETLDYLREHWFSKKVFNSLFERGKFEIRSNLVWYGNDIKTDV